MNKSATVSLLRWSARALSIISLCFVLLFAFGQIPSLSALTRHEVMLFAFIPVGMCLGLIIAWWRERLGGAIVVGSIIGFYLVHYLGAQKLPTGPWFLILALPGFLFLFCPPEAILNEPHKKA
jgi:hypothetical protein